MIDLSKPEILDAYTLGVADGENSILDTLGISRKVFDDILTLKATGSAVIISMTVHDLSELPDPDFTDSEFLNPNGPKLTHAELTKELYPGCHVFTGTVESTPSAQTCPSRYGTYIFSDPTIAQTSWGSSSMDVPQGPGAGTASSGRTEEREYDYADPWNHPADGNPDPEK